ncbi:DUF3331 domain-containing protein [Burkholderia dolosa]|uniref:DUF3331 domain-containing protein n=1 Tax=Burkholderia dolosa TaxID=152500 RepID=UPI001B908157|nr:DUF3331 domain-containing protein [Burkholderia dolosa]MBR8312033.1 DUF3331 domain-containing protein [Burkholderia dolosa]
MPNTIESTIRDALLPASRAPAAAEQDALPTPDSDVAHRRSRSSGASVPAPVDAAVSPLRPQLFITVLEAGDDGLLIRWVESGRCHYGEQRWRLRVAVQPGRCAISGRPIEPGDPVFRPVRRPVPANGDEMIRPASVRCTCAASDVQHDASAWREDADAADVLD